MNYLINRKNIVTTMTLLVILSLGVFTVAAVLTPSFNIWHADVFARASFADPTDITITVNGNDPINVTNARETMVQRIVIGPGGNTGWHSHPGPVVVLIKLRSNVFL